MSIYTAGGLNSKFEKASAASIKKIAGQMERLQGEIVAIMERALSTPKRAGTYWKAVERELFLKYQEINGVYWNYASSAIPSSYAASLASIGKTISDTKKIAETAKKSARTLANSQASIQITTALVEDAVAAMQAATAGGYANARRITRMTQQALIEEWSIDAALARSISDGKGIEAFTRNLASANPEYARLLEQFKGERVVKAGSKTFTAEYYAELVARTKFHEAQAHAALQQAANHGTDLVVVSNHNTPTAICQPYEAKTFSISGKDKRFPILDQAPPFHPNCLHLLFPVFESAMIIDGTLAGQSAFSLGKSDRPPVPAGFVPIADRGVA